MSKDNHGPRGTEAPAPRDRLPPSRGDEAPATTSRPDFAGASSASVPAPTKDTAAGCDESVREAASALVAAMEGVRLPFRGDAWMRLLDLRNALARDPGTSQRAGKPADATAPAPAAALAKTEESSVRARVAALEEALRTVEWIGPLGRMPRRRCPGCMCGHPDDGGDGHDDDCIVARALLAGRGEGGRP